jgi:F0F1-type ATP synthase membrane subunit b/b'
MSALDKFFILLGRVALVAILLYLLYRFAFKPYFKIVEIPLLNQLGI